MTFYNSLNRFLLPIKAFQMSNRSISKENMVTLRLMYARAQLFNCVEQPLRPKSAWQTWNYNTEIFAFNQRLSEKFSEDNLKIAFTHKSYIDKEEKMRSEMGVADVSLDLSHNHQFIEKGCDICANYIKPYLRHFIPRLPEDGIRAIYDFLMTDEELGDTAKWIGCIDLILCEEFPPIISTLASTVKALIGALAVDVDENHAKRFILDFVLTRLYNKDIMDIWDIENPGLILKRILMRERLPPPEPRLLRQTGCGTVQACYIVGLYVNKQLIGSAPGETIEIAQQMAELNALRRLFNASTSEVVFQFGQNAYDLDLTNSKQEALYLKEWAPSLLRTGKMPLINCINAK